MKTPDRIGSYRVMRLLGAGGMGAVYEALDESIGRRVAIKVLHPDVATEGSARARFLNEARVVNRVRHPSLVTIYSITEAPDGSAYIVMEFLEGETLTRRMQRRGEQPLTLADALRYMRQAGSALAAVHAHGIVHRDLKPDNLMLVLDPEVPGGERVKLLDFGIAKVMEPAGSAKGITATGIGMGTPEYMPPEQIYGANKVDDRADVYSLGVILFELLAGRLPFEGEQRQLLGGHLFKPPPDLHALVPSLPSAVTDLVARMLAKEPRDRPSVSEFLRALRGIPTTYGTELPAISIALSSVTRRLSSRRWIAIAGAVVISAALLISSLMLHRGRAQPGAAATPRAPTRSVSAAAQPKEVAPSPPQVPPPLTADPLRPAASPSKEQRSIAKRLTRDNSRSTAPANPATERKRDGKPSETSDRTRVPDVDKKGLRNGNIDLLD